MKELLFATGNAAKITRYSDKLKEKRNYIKIFKRFRFGIRH